MINDKNVVESTYQRFLLTGERDKNMDDAIIEYVSEHKKYKTELIILGLNDVNFLKRLDEIKMLDDFRDWSETLFVSIQSLALRFSLRNTGFMDCLWMFWFEYYDEISEYRSLFSIESFIFLEHKELIDKFMLNICLADNYDNEEFVACCFEKYNSMINKDLKFYFTKDKQHYVENMLFWNGIYHRDYNFICIIAAKMKSQIYQPQCTYIDLMFKLLPRDDPGLLSFMYRMKIITKDALYPYSHIFSSPSFKKKLAKDLTYGYSHISFQVSDDEDYEHKRLEKLNAEFPTPGVLQ